MKFIILILLFFVRVTGFSQVNSNITDSLQTNDTLTCKNAVKWENQVGFTVGLPFVLNLVSGLTRDKVGVRSFVGLKIVPFGTMIQNDFCYNLAHTESFRFDVFATLLYSNHSYVKLRYYYFLGIPYFDGIETVNISGWTYGYGTSVNFDGAYVNGSVTTNPEDAHHWMYRIQAGFLMNVNKTDKPRKK